MDQHEPTQVDERRVVRREQLEGVVTVQFDEHTVVGPGQNVSDEGVFFVVEDALRVKVQLDSGGDAWRDAEVIRVQSMGDGKLGIAIKFV